MLCYVMLCYVGLYQSVIQTISLGSRSVGQSVHPYVCMFLDASLRHSVIRLHMSSFVFISKYSFFLFFFILFFSSFVFISKYSVFLFSFSLVFAFTRLVIPHSPDAMYHQSLVKSLLTAA